MRLETVDGTPIPERVIRVTIGSEKAGAALTNAAGSFAVNFTIPENVDLSAFEDRRVPVNATFAEPATNLGPASTGQIVVIPSGLLVESAGLLGLGVPWWAWLAILLLIVAVATGTYVLLSRREDQKPEEPEDDSADSSTTKSAADPDNEKLTRRLGERLTR